jgi:hypothetical protein
MAHGEDEREGASRQCKQVGNGDQQRKQRVIKVFAAVGAVATSSPHVIP